jgi:hypothetical protein
MLDVQRISTSFIGVAPIALVLNSAIRRGPYSGRFRSRATRARDLDFARSVGDACAGSL